MRGLRLAAALLAGWAQPARPQAAAPAAGEHARRLLDDALLASTPEHATDAPQDLVPRFKVAAEAAPRFVPALLDYAVALDRAANLEQAEAAYLAAASAADFPELRFAAAERAASLALDRGDADAARAAVALAHAAVPGDPAPFVLQAQVSLGL